MQFIPTEIQLGCFFLPGMMLYLLGVLNMFFALYQFRATPVSLAVRSGIYYYSRNSQWVGLMLIFFGTAVVCVNELAIILFICSVLLYHFRVLGEEQACLAALGKPYQDYLYAVRRYF
jgi:protein-S-isoprenylcysteine O-methyltransferase Ste14